MCFWRMSSNLLPSRDKVTTSRLRRYTKAWEVGCDRVELGEGAGVKEARDRQIKMVALRWSQVLRTAVRESTSSKCWWDNQIN